VAEGVLFSVLRGVAPALTVGLIESTEEGFFEDGATFMWSYQLPWKPSAKRGNYSIGGEISSVHATSLTQSPWALLPAADVPLAEEERAWTINVTAEQYLVMNPEDASRGIGAFGMLAVSDGNPSFLGLQFLAGLSGSSFLRGRSMDTFGAAYFYQGISHDLRDTLQPVLRLRDEQGFELFYAFAAAGWSRVTADLQLVDPFAAGSETRAFFALRWKVTF
jgi:porin